MEYGKIYYWLSEFNYEDECYSVVNVDEEKKEYLLLRVHEGTDDFTDFWRIGFRFYENRKSEFVKVETDAEYRELIERRKKLCA